MPKKKRFGDSEFDTMSTVIEKILRLVDEALRSGEVRQVGEVNDLGIKGSRIAYSFSVKTLADDRPEPRKPSSEISSIDELIKEGWREPLIDITDEGEYVTLTTELREVREDNVDLKIVANKLVISAGGPSRRYYREIPLPATVKPEKIEATYRNGVLQVRVEKA